MKCSEIAFNVVTELTYKKDEEESTNDEEGVSNDFVRNTNTASRDVDALHMDEEINEIVETYNEENDRIFTHLRFPVPMKSELSRIFEQGKKVKKSK